MTVPEYLRAVEAKLRAGNATEHTYRADLAALVEGLEPRITATNEPRRTQVGAPDYIISRADAYGALPVGYIEAKDVGADLKRVEAGEQLTRYRASLPNLILTDYLEFRWYRDGQLRASARLGAPDRRGHITRDKLGAGAVLQMLADFLSQSPPRLGNPRELAQRMAGLTHLLRDHVLNVLRREGEEGGLHAQLQAFRRTLVPDLDPEGFADMYAQTVAYGLFAARAAAPAATAFTRATAASQLPRTNPFLRRFFTEIASQDELDDRVSWLIDALAALLARADMEAVLRDFGRRTRREDPVVHFYETFLATYDPRLRERRGVYYTPEPVVSWMVRSVDRLIQTQLHRPNGLADPSTIVLDPALGTGTFLYAVVQRIHEGFVARGDRDAWPSYVAEKLLGRIFGFELLMAPYAVAHLKLGLLLQETGYNPRTSNERLGIYLTNTLAEGVDAPAIAFAEYISREANAATAVKRDKPIEVVIGNPPYSGHSANRGAWIGGLVRDYYTVDGRPLGERQPKWLQDDYVKFIRFGQWRVEQTGRGVLAFISNNGYIDNPTFRGMRQSLLNTFSRIYILNLHGNANRREQTPEGGPDENVFDIRQGVAIALFVKEPGASSPAQVYYADLWGKREDKYQFLSENDIESTAWTEVAPHSPSYLFTPQDTDLRAEYDQGWKLTIAIPTNNVGFVTARDSFVIGFDEPALRERIDTFRATEMEVPTQELEARFGLKSTSSWKLREAREKLRTDPDWRRAFTECLYRPFDIRPIYYSPDMLERPVYQVQRHMLPQDNVGLVTTRSIEIGRGFEHVLCTNRIIGHHTVSVKEVNYLFPLYLYPEPGQSTYQRADAIEAARKAIRAREGELGAAETMRQLTEVGELVRRLYPQDAYPRWPNLAPRFIAEIEERTGLRWAPEGGGTRDGARTHMSAPTAGADAGTDPRVRPDTPVPTAAGRDDGPTSGAPASEGQTVPSADGIFTPEDVFHYTYAVLHSPTYRARYAPFLKSDFPRVPLTADRALFRDLAALGARLVDLHLLRDGREGSGPSTAAGAGGQARRGQAGVPVLPGAGAARTGALGGEDGGTRAGASDGADAPPVGYPQPGTNQVDRVTYDETERRVFINKTQHFTNVAPEVWNFHVGGYRVAEKWLKDRRGRTLSYDDITHYQRTIAALAGTVDLMGEIDARIPGWPLA